MKASDSESALGELRNWNAKLAIVLGSGLNTLTSKESSPNVVAYSRFAELPKLSVPGHVGQFVLDEVAKVRVIFAQGRVHLYEGHSAQEITAGVQVLAKAGIKTLILTNAAGSLNRSFEPGQWMILKDHINLTGTSPLLGAPAFVDMTRIYSQRMRKEFVAAASKANVILHEGVYVGLSGPQYETPAEVRMLQTLGADAVGMSTVLEAIQAHALGLELAAFSCLTNFGAGISLTELSHEEVLKTGRTSADAFVRLLTAAIPSL